MKIKFSLNQMKLDEISNSKTNSYFSQKWNCKGVKPKTHSRWMACLSSVNKYDMIHWYRYPYEKKSITIKKIKYLFLDAKKCKKCKKW